MEVFNTSLFHYQWRSHELLIMQFKDFASRNKKLLGAPGRTTRNKKLLYLCGASLRHRAFQAFFRACATPESRGPATTGEFIPSKNL